MAYAAFFFDVVVSIFSSRFTAARRVGQVPVAHHLAQARFDVQPRGGQPAVSLARLLPVVDLRTALLDELN